MAAISLMNVTKDFGDRKHPIRAVDDLTLDIRDRELLVLLGPSGCGKTTTLRLVAGLEHTSTGTIAIGGNRVNDVAPKDRDVAMVFQDYALYPHLSVYDNLAFGLKMRRTPRDEIRQRVGEVAKLLALDELLARRPHSLSGGQKQRVAFGRAIVRRPNVYLFDEPLANLDAQLRAQLRVELKRMQRSLGMTAMYVTHDQHEAMSLGDRVAVMKDGKIQQCAEPMEVYEHPANRFVAGFVGTPPMNFLEGRLACDARRPRFVFDWGYVPLPEKLARSAGEAGHDGERMVMGIRPEQIRLLDSAGNEDSITLQVTMVEPLGDRLEVHLRMSDGQVAIAKVPASAEVREGQETQVVFAPQGIALFEPGPSGTNLGLNGDGSKCSEV
ncbi:MAG: ABC transporter ATP-binding protein [Planctomycetes bacterium]|nr:ABC transporter ATP-binding protein [Planctomycetota bacterium]